MPVRAGANRIVDVSVLQGADLACTGSGDGPDDPRYRVSLATYANLEGELWTTTDGDRLHAVLNETPSDDEDEDEFERSITISNDAGLHARPATLIVELVKGFDGAVTVTKGEKTVKAGSIMGVLSLGAVNGDEVTFSVDGDSGTSDLLDQIETILTTKES